MIWRRPIKTCSTLVIGTRSTCFGVLHDRFKGLKNRRFGRTDEGTDAAAIRTAESWSLVRYRWTCGFRNLGPQSRPTRGHGALKSGHSGVHPPPKTLKKRKIQGEMTCANS